MARCLAALCLVVALAVSLHAVELTLDPKAIGEAILIGQSHLDRDRTRFHQGYRLTVNRPPVDWIDVITPFHRVALAAEARARAGNRLFAQREAFATLKEAPDQITLLIELTFHPLNRFVGIPAYDIALVGPGGTRARPLRVDRYPRFRPRTGTLAPELPSTGAAPILGNGDPLVGGTIVAPFNAAMLDAAGRYTVVMTDGASEVASVALDLAGLR
jgi:hypothetical protein